MSEAEKILKAINAAAKKLPENWNLSIDIEQGYAGVSLVDPFGDVVDSNDFCGPDDTISEQLENAIAHAVEMDGTQ